MVYGCAVLYLYFTGREVALEVLAIGGGIPQAPLGIAEQLQVLHLLGGVSQGYLLDLRPRLQRYEIKYAGLYSILAARDAGVVHTVTALVAVEWCLAGFPAWVPDNGLGLLAVGCG